MFELSASSVQETLSAVSTFKTQLQSTFAQSSYCQGDSLITHDSLPALMQIHLTLAMCDWLLRTYGLRLLSVIVVNNSGGCLADGLAGISSALIAR